MPNIRSALQRVKDPIIRERLLMVQAAQKLPLREAAKTFRCVHSKIDYWKKRYDSHGLIGLQTASRCGRPKKINVEIERKIKRIVSKHNATKGWKTRQVKELIIKESGVTYSFRHTIRILHSWGLSKIKPRPRYAFSKQEDRDAFIKKTKATWHVNRSIGR